MYKFGNKLNRSYSIHLPLGKKYCSISVYFNKMNSFIGFNIDRDTYNDSKSNSCKYNNFDDLTKSAFATTFLDIRNFEADNLDIRNQFNDILSNFKNKIHYETNETIKLSKIKIRNNKYSESCLYIYIFRFTDYGDDFLYCLAERQHIDTTISKKIVRSSACQLSTPKMNEVFNEMIENSNKSFIEKENVDQALGDVFKKKQIKKRDFNL